MRLLSKSRLNREVHFQTAVAVYWVPSLGLLLSSGRRKSSWVALLLGSYCIKIYSVARMEILLSSTMVKCYWVASLGLLLSSGRRKSS